MISADSQVACYTIEFNYQPAYGTRWSRAFCKTCKLRERTTYDSAEIRGVWYPFSRGPAFYKKLVNSFRHLYFESAWCY